MIHLLKVPKARLDSPTNDIGAGWTECNPATAANFSAVEYYFARDLQRALHVPVGVIESDWGGSPAEVWMQRNSCRPTPPTALKCSANGLWPRTNMNEASPATMQQKNDAKEKGLEFTNAAPRRPWKPGELYNGMIAPLAGYAIKGVLWYQGESNAGSADDAMEYHTLFPDLIRDWRGVWNEGEFPFLLVQLAPYGDIRTMPSESSWASVREAQLRATQILPHLGMAVITDVGDPHNIHPIEKQPVGARLALAARAIAYHQPIEYSGPVLKRAKMERTQTVLTFDHVDGGLEARGGELTGFAVCGRNGKFVWANAEITAFDKVVVHSPEVLYPVAVRYGWANYPVVNLWNKAGLPGFSIPHGRF